MLPQKLCFGHKKNAQTECCIWSATVWFINKGNTGVSCDNYSTADSPGTWKHVFQVLIFNTVFCCTAPHVFSRVNTFFSVFYDAVIKIWNFSEISRVFSRLIKITCSRIWRFKCQFWEPVHSSGNWLLKMLALPPSSLCSNLLKSRLFIRSSNPVSKNIVGWNFVEKTRNHAF